jgi:methionine-rich copper-binding protein CopC
MRFFGPAGSSSPWLLVLAVATAWAHAHLEESLPADGSVIHSAPSQLVLRFSESAQLTALSIEKSDGSRQKIAPLPQGAQTRVVVPLPALAPGRYRVSWRALGADGHLVPGQIQFTLSQ